MDLNKIKEYATKCHNDTNHKYGSYVYSAHLKMVDDNAQKFIHLIPEEDRILVRAGCWTHDLIEDARQTYNDVKKVCGEQVAEIAYALTNEKGKNRKERANDKYYAGIMAVKYAPFIKLMDRISNVEFSILTGGDRMAKAYKDENDEFVKKIYLEEYHEVFAYLESLFINMK